MGYLGLVGAPDHCRVDSIYAGQPIAFRGSPYGFSFNFGSFGFNRFFVPYQIDPGTLEVDFREDLRIGPYNESLGVVAQLDTTTSILSLEPAGGPPHTSSLFVMTRSGNSIALSGAQHSVTTDLPEVSIVTMDSTHFLRRYTEPGVANMVFQVFSVSGSTISLVSSTSFPRMNYTVTRNPGEAGGATVILTLGSQFPFHWDSSSDTLYASGFRAAIGASPPRIQAIPCTIGGSVVAPGLAWRSMDSQNVSLSVCKLGTSECIGNDDTFIDDGTTMFKSTWGTAGWADAWDGASSYGSYFTTDVATYPAGTSVTDPVPDLVTQSGLSASYTPAPLTVLCPGEHPTDLRTKNVTRHDTNLGAASTHLGSGIYRLFAFSF